MPSINNIFLLSSGANGRLDPVQSNLLSLSFNDCGSVTLGVNNNLSGCTSSILGGNSNIICNSPGSFPAGITLSDFKNNTIVGGRSNCIDRSSESVIGGGFINCIKGWFIGNTGNNRFGITNIIGGGINNYILGDTSLIAGGYNNCIVSGYRDGINGGVYNKIAESSNSNILGGEDNTVCSSYSAILVGSDNTITTGSDYSLILAGNTNSIRTTTHSTILFGQSNVTSGSYLSSIVNGFSACIKKSTYSSILHGYNSSIEQSEWSTILSSRNSHIKNAGFSTIVNGNCNIISGSFYQVGNIGQNAVYASTILNGQCNRIFDTNSSSILAGSNSKICSGHIGATIIADSQVRNHDSSGPHTLTLDFASGTYIKNKIIFQGDNYIPSTPTSSGISGQIAYDSNYHYRHNGLKWKRTALSEW